MFDETSASAAKEAAFKYLGYRMRTRREIEKYLAKKNFPDDVVAEVMETLVGYKYVDDLEFAKWYIESCLKFNKWGMKKIKHELALRGVGADVFDEAAAGAEYPVADTITRLIEKRLGGEPTGDLDAKEKRKLFAYLMNRGFAYDEIQAALTREDM